jgi:hypothetical protein
MTNIPTNRGTLERSQPPTPDGIQASNFGGLNTVSSPLAIPYEDSPLLLNAVVNINGAIEKRKGSRVVRSDTIPGTGITLIPVTTTLGYYFQVVKNGKDIQLFELVGNELLLRMTKSNVWSSAAENIKASYVSTSEPEQRIIMCTGLNVPVQLTFTERRYLFTASQAWNGTFIPEAELLKTATTTNALYFVDGALTAVTNVSYNAPLKRLNITYNQTFPPGSYVLDVVLITWQWWTEALFYYGDRFFDTVTRFNDKPTDRHVAIPANLRDDIDPLDTFPNLYPITVLYHNSPNYVYYTPNASRLPLGFRQYGFSDGTVQQPIVANWIGTATNGQVTFNIGTTDSNWYWATPQTTYAVFNGTQVFVQSLSFNGNTLTVTLSNGVTPGPPPPGNYDILQVLHNVMPIVPSPFFITFGAIQPRGDQQTVYISRQRGLPFNGGNGIIGQNLYVKRDDIIQFQYIGGPNSNYGDYQLFNFKGQYTALTSLTAVATHIDFTGSSEVGVPASAKIRIVNKQISKFVGTSATNSDTPRVDGSWVPCYGISAYANYYTGSFPGCVALYQGRLVFAGFPQNPLAVAFSSVTDFTVPNELYMSFQIGTFNDKPQDPVDVLITSTADDFITGLVEHQGNLFVFTRNSLFRVSAAGRGVLTADNVAISSVAKKGTPNQNCITKANDTLVFMSDDGVYLVTPSAGDTSSVVDYKLEEISTKVRNRFSNTTPTKRELPWVAFNAVSKTLVVAQPRKDDTKVASYLLTFDMFRQAWSEFDTVGHFNTFTGATCTDIASRDAFILVVSRNRLSPTDTVYLKLDDRRYLDFVVSATGTGSGLNVTVPRLPYTQHTTSQGVRDYRITFPVLPLSDVQDVTVKYNNQTLDFGVGYVKTHNGIRLLFDPVNNATLTISHRRPDTDYDAGKLRYNTQTALDLSHAFCYVDNIPLLEFNGFTVTHNPTDTVVNIGTAPNNSKIEVGVIYTTVYATPTFTWDTLRNYKRLLYWTGLFDNAAERYTITDVNTNSNQDAESLVGKPKTRFDCNVSFVYNNTEEGYTSADLYGFDELVWDFGLFDIYLPYQYDDYVLLKQALQGVGYSFQCLIWTTDEAGFKLIGYQISGKIKGTKYQFWGS